MKKRTMYSNMWICLSGFIMILLAYFPHLQSEMVQGSDDWFHFHRIYALAWALRNGIFPVKVHHLAGFGYGYGVGFFYSDYFLYIPALLINVFNMSLSNAYRVFAFLIYVGIYCSMFYCVYQLTREKWLSFWGASIYLFSNKVMEAFYCNMAVGQMCAFIFFPMAIVGMYLFLERGKKPFLLMIGFWGLIYSHTISTFTAFVVCMFLVIFNLKTLLSDKRKMLNLVISVGITTLATSSYWLPMFEQMKAQLLKVKIPWTTSVENVLNIKYVIKSQECLGYIITIMLLFNIVTFLITLFKKKMRGYKFLFISLGMILITMCKPFWYFMNVNLNIKFLQSPARLMAPVTVLIIVDTVMMLNSIKSKKIEYVAMGVLVCSFALSVYNYSHNYLNISDDHINKAVNNEIAAFGAGEEWLPIMTDREEIMDADIAIDNEGNKIMGEKRKGYSQYIFEADLGKEYYNVPYIWYKGYTALDETGEKYEISQNPDTGMVQVYMPKEASGIVKIEVYYEGTKYQKLAYMASVIGILLFGVYVMLLKKEEVKTA